VFDGDGNPWMPAADFPDYGWAITVRLIGWVRDQMRFASVDVLSQQLGRDVVRVGPMVESMIGQSTAEKV
jgi:Riboflavin kinase